MIYKQGNVHIMGCVIQQLLVTGLHVLPSLGADALYSRPSSSQAIVTK